MCFLAVHSCPGWRWLSSLRLHILTWLSHSIVSWQLFCFFFFDTSLTNFLSRVFEIFHFLHLPVFSVLYCLALFEFCDDTSHLWAPIILFLKSKLRYFVCCMLFSQVTAQTFAVGFILCANWKITFNFTSFDHYKVKAHHWTALIGAMAQLKKQSVFLIFFSNIVLICKYSSISTRAHACYFADSYLDAWSFIFTWLCKDVQLNSNSNRKLTCKQKREQQLAEVPHLTCRKRSMCGLSWVIDGTISSARTYLWLGAKYWITDIAWVAVGAKGCALDLEVGNLLRWKKRHEEREDLCM